MNATDLHRFFPVHPTLVSRLEDKRISGNVTLPGVMSTAVLSSGSTTILHAFDDDKDMLSVTILIIYS